MLAGRLLGAGSGQHDVITKVEQGLFSPSKAAVLSFSVTHCFANLFLFLRLGTQRRYSIARASTKDLYEKRLICTVSLERLPTCFHTRFIESFQSYRLTNIFAIVVEYTFFYKKLVYKKLVLKFQETLVLCLIGTKKLFKVKSMDIIANRSPNLYS